MTAFEHDLTPVKPDYDGGSIVNLMRSIGDKFGAAASDYPPLAALPPDRLEQARRVLLIVIDGLGAELLRNVGRGSQLEARAGNTITSVYPPTTASAITTFMTGLAPQQHGLTGWFMHFRRLGAVTAVLPFVPRYGRKPMSGEGVDLASLLCCPSFFDRIKAQSATLQPAAIADSDFSRHLAQGAERIPYTTLAEFANRLQAYCRGESSAAYMYAYWSDLDRLAHIHGPSSDAVKVHYDEIDAALSAIIKVCEHSGTLLIITADHGFIDSGAEERIDLENHPGLADTLSLPLCGEPRTAYCYVRHRSAQAFEKYIDRELAQVATWLPSHRLIDDGWFGVGKPHAELAARIGDYTLLMRGRYTIRDRVAGERDIHLNGVHGGTSAAEQYVPLILAGP